MGGVERPVAIGVRDGRIVTLDADPSATATLAVELAPDEVLLPGLVDTHVHVNEPGRTEWEGFDSATRAAAAGGVTTVVDMPLNSVPPTTTAAALQVKQDAARGRVHVDVGFWGGAVPGNVPDLAPLHDAGVMGFKCFLLPSGVEEFPHLDDAGLRDALDELARLDALLVVHAEDEGEIDPAPLHSRAYADFVATRPPRAELVAIERLVAAAADTGARVHVVHLSAADALPVIRDARARGVRLTVETCPHYLALTGDDVADGHTEFKCCPPIRDAGNRDLLWAALGRRHPRPGGLRPLAVHGRAEAARHRRLRGRVGRHRVRPARAAGGVDRGPASRPRARRRRPLDVRGTGRPGRAAAQGPARRRPRRRPLRAGSRRVVHGRRDGAPPPQPRHGVRRAYAHRHRAADLAARSAGGGEPARGPAAAEGRGMSYYVPRGGLPGQDELTTDRAVFTEAYAVLPRGTMRDIVASRLPHWDDTRAWVLARPLSGFAETFSQYVVEVGPGGGSDRPDDDVRAEAVLFVVDGEPVLRIAGDTHRLRPGSYVYLPAATDWSLRNAGDTTMTFHWIRKTYEPVDDVDAPEPFVTHEDDVAPEPMPGTDAWATQRFVDPLDVRHDMHVNIVELRARRVDPVPGDPRDGARALRPGGQGRLPAQPRLGRGAGG